MAGSTSSDGAVRDATGEVCCVPAGGVVVGEPWDEVSAQRLAGVLKALAEPTRLRLLSLIAAHPDGQACVCDLTGPVMLSQPTVSHHMRVLVEAGLVEREQRGRWAYFRLLPAARTVLGQLEVLVAAPAMT